MSHEIVEPAREPAPVTQVSAHACNDADAIASALALGVEWVEFDVQLDEAGDPVLAHDAPVAVGTAPPLQVALDGLTGPDVAAGAHVDLKFPPGAGGADGGDDGCRAHVAAVEQCVAALGATRMLVTTHDDAAVRAVRDWADAAGHPDLLVGLSLGRGLSGEPVVHQVGVRFSEVMPRVRVEESRANLMVARKIVARAGAASYARREDLPLLVWTADTERELTYWMRPGRAWIVTTNRPARALEIREEWKTRRRGPVRPA